MHHFVRSHSSQIGKFTSRKVSQIAAETRIIASSSGFDADLSTGSALISEDRASKKRAPIKLAARRFKVKLDVMDDERYEGKE